MAAERNAKDSILGWRHAGGFLLFVFAFIAALGLFSYDPSDVALNHVPANAQSLNLIGAVGAYLSLGLFWWLGVAAYLVPIAALIFAGVFLFDREERVWPHVAWFTLAMTALTNLLELYGSAFRDLCQKLNVVDPGGLLSHSLTTKCMMPLFSKVGTGIVLWLVFAGATVMTVGIPNVLLLWKWIRRAINWVIVSYNLRREETLDRKESLEREALKVKRRMRLLEKESELDAPSAKPAARAERTPTPEPAKARTRTPDPEPVDEEDAEADIPVVEKPALRPATRPKPEPIATPSPEPVQKPAPEPVPEKPKRMPVVAAVEPAPFVPPVQAPRTVGGRPYILPPIDLLNAIPKVRNSEPTADEATMGRVLVETLAEFGIEVEMVASKRGPVVTSYELLPAPGVRVEKIMALSNNISLSLKSAGVRVQAPIPGKGVVGIEVPNASSTMVCIREIVESELWHSEKIHLPLALGKDVGGKDLIVDLASMPHLLIAGATGAGKTVCMNSILAGLLIARTPDELRMILVDPKIVEFSTYNNLPHLVVPVVTNPKKVALALRWAITEMEKRYKLFAKVGVRNIEGFNTRPVVKQPDLFAQDGEEPPPANDAIPEKVPYIVIVIDELADLMLVDQAEIENCIARLAQLSRAVGIHMIIATQRPSVNVITGTIKANFPARISFQVAQKVDSRTILDTVGAEKLLGKGDMLYLQPSNSKVIRAQGTLTQDEEINRIVDFIKKQGEPVFVNEIHEKLEKSSAAPGVDDGQENDELIERAIEVIRETQRASTSSLQRRMRIGYTRAARIIDILEERGIVGPPRGADAREILIDLDGQVPQNPPASDDGNGE